MGVPLALFASFLVSLTLIPIIIRLARSINLMDKPDRRKIHSKDTPSMGGIAIFLSLMFALFLAAPFAEVANEKFFLAGAILIFFLGIRDDMSSLLAKHKLVVQVFAASLVVYFGGIQLHGLNGLFGVHALPWHFDSVFSVFVIVVMTNAFNLIDGIDGLAGSVAVLIAGLLGWFFYQNGNSVETILCFAIAGATMGFLLFNWYPSKIFMGDTGSMVLGFLLTTLMIRFLGASAADLNYHSPVALSLALFALPSYDTLRVITIRLINKRPPLSPDRNHVHHILLKLGYNHAQSSGFLIVFNLSIVLLALSLQFIGDLWLILSLVLTVTGVGLVMDRKLMKKEASRLAKIVPPEIKLSQNRTPA